MKKANISLIASLAGLLLLPARLSAATAEESKIFTPYFNMSLAESLYVPSQGDFFSGGLINTQVGLLSKVAKKHNLFGLYNFRYLGPSFQPQDSKQFAERSIDNAFSLEYRWQLSEQFRVRPGYATSRGYRRSGVNEAWQNGLYNMDSQGGQLAVDYLFGFLGKNGTLTAQYLFRGLEFPNYTDLLREFQNAGQASELSGGLQNQGLKQWALRSYWNNFTAGISHSKINYDNQTVVGTNGQYDPSTKQEDKSTTLDFGFNQRLWIFEAAPNVSYTVFKSNQNFLRFKYFGAPMVVATLGNGDSDVTLIENAYSYKEYTVDLPLFINMGMKSKWAISGGWSITHRTYTDRPPRDQDNNYLSGQQRNTLTRFYAGFRKHMNEIADLSLMYTLVIGSSNNKFERYLPYNYTGQSVGLAYNLTF